MIREWVFDALIRLTISYVKMVHLKALPLFHPMYDLEKVVEVDSLKEILSLTTEYDIYSFYIGNDFKVGKVMKSPLRDDIHPSFGIFKATMSGNLLYKDQATGKSGNVVSFVSELFNLTYEEALQKIWKDTTDGNINISEEGKKLQDSYKKVKTIISVQRKNFTETDDEYWEQYFITRDILKEHNVCPISTFWVNDNISTIFYSKKQPLYAYAVFDKYQIYCPYGKRKDKFRTNCTIFDMHGLEQLPQSDNLLIITKSKKDVMVLYRLGYNAIAPTGENTPIPDTIINNLKERFKRIFILYDNDEPGIKGGSRLGTTHNIKQVYIPTEYYTKFGIKDISDYVKAFKITKSKQLLKELFKDDKEDN